MAIKIQPVPGAKKDSYAASQPVMTCDSPGCDSKVEGDPGSGGHDGLKVKAFDRGFKTDMRTSKHYCATHAVPSSPPGPSGASIAKALEASRGQHANRAR